MTGKFVEYTAKIKLKISEAGLFISNTKSIPYGEQIHVTDNVEALPVSLYEGKKGFSAVLGGKSGPLKERLEDILALPHAASTARSTTKTMPSSIYGFEDVEDFDGCWIGSDESGKGDVFGPLVVAGIIVTPGVQDALEKIGVRDCKTLSDKSVRSAADKIRTAASGLYREIEISPARYNELYSTMRSEGKNLNHLLAWAHVRVLEDLLVVRPCKFAIIDQFADAKVVESRLLTKGRNVKVIQKPKAENNLAVAAASILARDRFVSAMDLLEKQFSIHLPKGAGLAVNSTIDQFIGLHGKGLLSQVGKLHFKTFERV